jgi:enamine deaminase RidA (YjgF/YER057c/UK114 family)
MVASGRVLAVAGQLGVDRVGRLVGADFPGQFEAALDNVVAVVQAADGDPRDIISMTLFVVDRAQYQAHRAELGQGWRLRLGQHYPAMTVVEVRGLLQDGALLEIAALAILPS